MWVGVKGGGPKHMVVSGNPPKTRPPKEGFGTFKTFDEFDNGLGTRN